jgi:hypothetical protein
MVYLLSEVVGEFGPYLEPLSSWHSAELHQLILPAPNSDLYQQRLFSFKQKE